MLRTRSPCQECPSRDGRTHPRQEVGEPRSGRSHPSRNRDGWVLVRRVDLSTGGSGPRREKAVCPALVESLCLIFGSMTLRIILAARAGGLLETASETLAEIGNIFFRRRLFERVAVMFQPEILGFGSERGAPVAPPGLLSTFGSRSLPRCGVSPWAWFRRICRPAPAFEAGLRRLLDAKAGRIPFASIKKGSFHFVNLL